MFENENCISRVWIRNKRLQIKKKWIDPFQLGHINIFLVWVKTGFLHCMTIKNILLLFYPQQPGNYAFASCEPQFFLHI